jgi:hypothetical protein
MVLQTVQMVESELGFAVATSDQPKCVLFSRRTASFFAVGTASISRDQFMSGESGKPFFFCFALPSIAAKELRNRAVSSM